MRGFAKSLGLLLVLWPAACKSEPNSLGRIYGEPGREIGDDRTPVVVLPGLLGSKLEDSADGKRVWGAFTFGAVDVDKPDGARRFALPMEEGKRLSELVDSTLATEVLDVLVADVGVFRGLNFGAYVDILTTLAVGKYRDRSFGESGAVDYGGLHYTCFQYAYDWRRDISESAIALDRAVREAQDVARGARGLPDTAPLSVDVIAHSMGGLVLRYYLRYGTQPLPEDGSLPELTWAGARHVRRAILIGPPNAGSAHALEQLVNGMNLHPLFPNYRPALIGTLPSPYQLLPRARHAAVVDAESGEPIDVFDPKVWERYGWGLADPGQARMLEWLLPDIVDADERRRVALDHLAKCLARAQALHRALDLPADPPPGLELRLFAGDAEDTLAVIGVGADGTVRASQEAPGDGTVLRSSALMDERVGAPWSVGLLSPIPWSRVQFVPADHLGLTRDVSLVDNLLYMLLEEPDR